MTSVNKYNREDIVDREIIGEGAFGKVYKAKLRLYSNHADPQVAVKVVKSGYQTAIAERNRMLKLDHPNVVTLIGVVYPDDEDDDSYYESDSQSENYDFESDQSDDDTENSVPWLIMDLMPCGNLLEYISNFDGGCPGVGMVSMAHGVAIGMDYLHRTAKLVHRDLAARNILVGHNWEVKIGDFGLCDDYYDSDYYYGASGRPCPIRWMPPENLPGQKGKFSRKGDIWSYGVVIFEIWSRGRTPYEGLTNIQVLHEVNGGRTPLHYFDVKARQYILELMEDCWSFEPQDRPNFRKIINRFEDNDPDYFE